MALLCEAVRFATELRRAASTCVVVVGVQMYDVSRLFPFRKSGSFSDILDNLCLD